MPPHRDGYCDVSNAAIFTVFLCSVRLIVSMTIERLYSITRPHKAASFNTVKRAKITIMSIVFFTICYNIPHLFISSVQGRQCLPYGTAMGKLYGEVYYWLSFIVLYTLPFTLLLIMNCVIIHKLRNRVNVIVNRDVPAEKGQGQSQGQSQGQIKLLNIKHQINKLHDSTVSNIWILNFEYTSISFLSFRNDCRLYQISHTFFWIPHFITSHRS